MKQMEKTQKKAKLPKLTKKRRKFVEHYVIDENGQEAAKKSFNVTNDNSARAVASELLTFPNVIEAIEVKRKSLKEALIDEGINEKYIAEKVNVLLKAVDEKGMTDYTAVDKGLKHATNIYGVEDVEKPKENIYNFFFEPKFQQNIRSYDENLKNLILNKDENNKQD